MPSKGGGSEEDRLSFLCQEGSAVSEIYPCNLFFSFQVFQREKNEDNETPFFYLSISTDCTTWSISNSLESRTCYLQSSSAGTSCPAAPSNAVNTHAARTSWLFFDSRGNLKEGNIQLFCATHKHLDGQPQANQQHIEISSNDSSVKSVLL